MIGKLFTILAVVVSVAVAQNCGCCGGYLSTGYSTGYLNTYGTAYPSRVLNEAFTVPAVSAYPVGSPIATPAVLSPCDPTVATPVLASGVVRSGIYNTFGGCATGLLSY